MHRVVLLYCNSWNMDMLYNELNSFGAHMQPLSLSETIQTLLNQALSETIEFLPTIIAALVILILGTALAKAMRALVVKMLNSLSLSTAVNKTPIEHFLKDADITHKFEEIIGSMFYWVIMLVVIHTSVTILGLSSLSQLLKEVISYLPRIISAIIVLFFGVLFAGLIETLVKGALKTVDSGSARLLGKISSYLVVLVSVMAAVSELGIAREFILVLFAGLIATLTIAGGLAFGLGSKDVVAKILDKWYKSTQRELDKK